MGSGDNPVCAGPEERVPSQTMPPSRVTRFSAWWERAAAALAAALVAVILAFYVWRLFVPQPLFAADAGAYLIRALYPDEMVIRNPYVTAIGNGAHLSLIRLAYRVGQVTGGQFMLIDNAINALLYLGGLLAFWRAGARRTGRREQLALLLLTLGFAYYRFVFSNMAEGPYVAALAVVALITLAWWRRRPALHALAAGAACALLVLSKPHGLAVVGALGAVAVVDAAVSGQWTRLPLRAGLFAAAFLAVGNGVQFAAEEPVRHPLLFFMSDFYSGALGVAAPAGAAGLGLQALAITGFAALVLAGPPLALGLAELVGRRRAQGAAFRLAERDVVFLVLAASLAATLAMTAVFELKIAGTPSETYRLWGRYFEFFAPLLWVAAAPAMAARPTRAGSLACAALTLAGLTGLLGLLQRGWIILPWDNAVLTAFFAPDPERAPVPLTVPLRGLATAATLAAAIAYGLRLRPASVGCALLLTLSLLSTWLDQVWLGDTVLQRRALDHDLHAIAAQAPAPPSRIVLITPDANLGHLGFLALKAQPFVVLGDPAAPPAGALEGAAAVVASGAKPPAGQWTALYRGSELSLWRAADGAALPNTP
jgi:hypothetical protein